MTGVLLLLRTRRAPAALVTACGGSAVSWGGYSMVSDRPDAGVPVVALTVALLVCALAGTLGTPDADLERAAAVPWARWRAVHLLVAAGTVVALLAPTLATGARFGPVALVGRDAAGLLGLAALAATLLDGQRAWLPPLGWTLTAVVLGVLRPPATLAERVLCWPVQGLDDGWAAATAAGLAVTGVAVYAARGPAAAGRG